MLWDAEFCVELVHVFVCIEVKFFCKLVCELLRLSAEKCLCSWQQELCADCSVFGACVCARQRGQGFYTAVCVEQVFKGQLFVGICFVVDISDIKHIHSPFKLRAIWIRSKLDTVPPVRARYCSDDIGMLRVGRRFVSEGVDLVL